MKKKCRNILMIAAAALLCVENVMPVQAGAWRQDGNGWWWQEEDGTYPSDGWRWIDSDGDGTAECYYFSPAGYCLQDAATPDGFLVNASGEWVEGGVVQHKTVEAGVAKPEETELSYESAREKLLAYYNNQWADDGNYDVSDDESWVTETGYCMVIRYQMSDEAAMELIMQGGMPTANRLVGMVVVNKKTGIATFEDGEEILLK